ncbi:hypothetical protein EDC96DRAFT_566163 [Choanephora cucurbitarum]|nr:hypothetical protein EDC96DRAFT_566163 [Choanephora cucurbitarum]
MYFNCRSLVLAAASGEQRPGWRLVWEYMVSCLHAATPDGVQVNGVSEYDLIGVKYLVSIIWCQVSGVRYLAISYNPRAKSYLAEYVISNDVNSMYHLSNQVMTISTFSVSANNKTLVL